jgi:hypothetical protein
MGKTSTALLAGTLIFALAARPGFSRPKTEDRTPAIKIYRLVKIIQGGDFDRKAIAGIDSLPVPFPRGSSHQIGDLPTKFGKSFIYKFQAAYEGTSAEGGRVEFHDILMVKLGCDSDIVEGYQYTLEWADAPSLDLNRVTAKGILLADGVEIRDLRLVNVRSGEPSPEEGRIEYNSR